MAEETKENWNMYKVGSLLIESEALKKAEKTLQFKHRWLNEGWVHASNLLIRDNSVSVGARLLYLLLMSRCFSKDFSYPGITTLSAELGVSVNSVISYRKELENKNWLLVKRRGQGKTNIYFLVKYK